MLWSLSNSVGHCDFLSLPWCDTFCSHTPLVLFPHENTFFSSSYDYLTLNNQACMHFGISWFLSSRFLTPRTQDGQIHHGYRCFIFQSENCLDYLLIVSKKFLPLCFPTLWRHLKLRKNIEFFFVVIRLSRLLLSFLSWVTLWFVSKSLKG